MASSWDLGDARDPTGHLTLEFRSIDTDGNGKLDQQELRTGLLQRKWREDDVDKMLSKLTQHGAVTLDQFLDKVTSVFPPSAWWTLDDGDEERLKEAFKEIDKDRNDRLDEEERREAMDEGGALARLLIDFGLPRTSLDSLKGAVDYNFFRQRFVREVEVERKRQALLRAEMERAVAACIPGGSPSDPLGGLVEMEDTDFRSFCRDKVAARMELVLGNAIGLSTGKLLDGMEAEHCQREDSEAEFNPGNYAYLTATTPRQEWLVLKGENGEAKQKAENASKGKRKISALSELMRNEMVQKANLQECEVLALQLYSGPMFAVYNTVLRGFPLDKFAALKGNRYTHTIYCIVSGVIKLSRVMVLPTDRKVYRGLRNLELPEEFVRPDEYGVTGGVEMAMLSTTLDRSVALQYAGDVRDDIPIVFEIHLGAIDRGADLSWLSQYPSESEILFPPRSYLEVAEGGSRVEECDGGRKIKVVELTVNANVISQTIEQIEGRRREFFRSASDTVLLEIKQEMSKKVESEEVLKELAKRPQERYEERHRMVAAEVEREAGEWVQRYLRESNDWFNNDFHYSRLVRELTGLKMMAVEKFEYWLSGPAGQMRDDVAKQRMGHVFRRREVQLVSELRELREKPSPSTTSVRRASDGEQRDPKEGRKLALKLCQRRGALADNVDEVNDLGEPPIVAAGVRGDLMHLELLCLAGCDVKTRAKDGSTALHRACMMGNLDFARQLVIKGADLHAVDEGGMTCLHVALDLGQEEMVRFLLKREEEQGREGGRYSPGTPLSGGGAGTPMWARRMGLGTGGESQRGSEEEVGNEGEALSGDTCAILASRGGHMKALRELLKFVEKKGGGEAAGNEILLQVNENSNFSCAHAAAANGHVHMLTFLLKRCPHLLHLRGHNGASVAYVAAESGHEAVLRFLSLRDGGKDLLMSPDVDGTTPAYVAAQNGQEAVLRYLLEQSGGRELFVCSSDGTTVAYAAAQKGHKEALECIEERLKELRGTEIDGFPGDVNGRLKAMLEVVDEEDGETCVHEAASHGKTDVLKWVFERCGKEVFLQATRPGYGRETCAHRACEQGRFESLQFLCDSIGAGLLELMSEDGWTCAHFAAKNGHADAFTRYIADKCEDTVLLHTDLSGRSCAHYAGEWGSAKALEAIADKGHAKLFLALDSDGVSCAFLAAKGGHEAALGVIAAKAGKDALLLGGRRETEEGPGEEMGCAHIAAANGHVAVLELLSRTLGSSGVSSPAGGGGVTAACYAASRGHVGCLKFLYKVGEQLITERTIHGSTTAYLAAAGGHAAALRFIASKEPLCLLLSSPDHAGKTPAHAACEGGHLEALRVLVGPNGERKGLVLTLTADGSSCAFIAAATLGKEDAVGGRVEMLRYLYEIGGRDLFMVVGNTGLSVAHACCCHPDESLIRSLLEMCGGLRKLLRMQTRDGFNCTDIALWHGHDKVATYIADVWGVQGVRAPNFGGGEIQGNTLLSANEGGVGGPR